MAGRPKGSPASASQRAAGRANLDKGRAVRAARAKAKAEDPDYLSEQQRWAMLLDGRLTVKDLSDKELKRRMVADSTGQFSSASKRRTLPSHIMSSIDAEYTRRIRDGIRKNAGDAMRVLRDLMNDPEVPPSVRRQCALDFLERTVGKTPEVIQIKSDDWAGVVGEAVEVERDLTDIEDYANGGTS